MVHPIIEKTETSRCVQYWQVIDRSTPRSLCSMAGTVLLSLMTQDSYRTPHALPYSVR
jgi:hypothetical protein